MILYYQPRAHLDELFVGQCTVHRASGSSAARWWLLWFNVRRESDGVSELFCIPINPDGPFLENGSGGRTWGTMPTHAHVCEVVPGSTRDWAVTPSVDVKSTGDAHAGSAPGPSLWHQTIEIRGVPDSEPWARGEAP